ncbi:MAG: thiol-disulfide oxidoreductase DCC family protein [Verrucomicrobiales bacterium]
MITDPTGKDVLFFDGDCLFCQRRVRWLLRHDRDGMIFFAPLQGELARKVVPKLSNELSTMVFVTACQTERQAVYIKSTAAAHLAARLPFPWRLGALLVVLPRACRDAAYDFVARRRNWLSKSGGSTCAVPDQQTISRFFA